MLNRTMRLVGLYYRTAAEEFFPAMGALQMPLLGWSKVRSPDANIDDCAKFLPSSRRLGRNGSILCSMQELYEG